MREPEGKPASTTRVAWHMPETMRLRRGKWNFCAGEAKGNSLMTAPPLARTSSVSLTQSGLSMASNPQPRTAMVFPFAAIAARCAVSSIPYAPPLTMTTPA